MYNADMKKSSLAMLVNSMLIFGTVGIFRRNIALPSAFIAFFRGLTGCLTILPFAGKRILKCKDAGKLLFSGALIGLNWILYGSALANPNGFSLNNHPWFIKRTKTKKSLLFSRNSLD